MIQIFIINDNFYFLRSLFRHVGNGIFDRASQSISFHRFSYGVGCFFREPMRDYIDANRPFAPGESAIVDTAGIAAAPQNILNQRYIEKSEEVVLFLDLATFHRKLLNQETRLRHNGNLNHTKFYWQQHLILSLRSIAHSFVYTL